MVDKSNVSLLIAAFGFHNRKMIEGRTRIQKEICLLKFKSKIPFTFNYRSYYYGPYSEELSETINMLVGVKLLKENMISVGYNTYRYDYSLTEQGEALFERICQKPNPLLGKIQKDVRKMEKIETPRLVSLAKAISGMESIC